VIRSSPIPSFYFGSTIISSGLAITVSGATASDGTSMVATSMVFTAGGGSGGGFFSF
jgi:hypothetical protein